MCIYVSVYNCYYTYLWCTTYCLYTHELFYYSIILIHIFFLGHCPTGNDPYTAVNETDCYNITAPNSIYTGDSGNLCHVDCSNRGLCNYKTGLCQCFNGLYGAACDDIDPQATYIYWNKGRQELDFQQYNHAQEQVL